VWVLAHALQAAWGCLSAAYEGPCGKAYHGSPGLDKPALQQHLPGSPSLQRPWVGWVGCCGVVLLNWQLACVLVGHVLIVLRSLFVFFGFRSMTMSFVYLDGLSFVSTACSCQSRMDCGLLMSLALGLLGWSVWIAAAAGY
jgi:hypothetical protein